MALFQFSTSISTTVSELAEKLTSWQDSGASISEIAISNINDISFLINDKYCNVKYNMSSSQNANYYWFLCDSVGYETLIVLCDSPIVNENGYKGSLGNALYNAIYFLHDGRLVRNPQIDEPICSQFNIPNGWSSLDTDSTILTKCTYNDGINLTIGTNQVADKLYISTNLSSVGYKTKIVTGAKEFICIGGFFYLEYNNLISSLSKYKKRIILSDAEIEFTAQGDFTTSELYSTNGEYYFSINNFSVLPNANNKLGIISATSGRKSYLNNLKYRVDSYHNTTIYIVFSLKDLGAYSDLFHLVVLPNTKYFYIEKTYFGIAEISKSFNFVLNKKYIAVLRIPVGAKVRYSAFLNKNKIITTKDYNESYNNNWNIRAESGSTIPPNIDIDYIGFCPEGHTDDKVYSNMNYLAKFFEVDLEEPS